MRQPGPQGWERLLTLLAPVHDRARITARRLARSPADGEDLFHEALIRAYEKLPGLRDPERFGAWFYAVLLSVHRNRSRRAFWKRFVSLERILESSGTRTLGEARATDPGDEGDGAARMRRALATLPAVQREAIVLHDLDGFRLDEIASIQAASLSAVKTRISRGRLRLRRHYERLGILGARAPESANIAVRVREGSAHG